MIKGMSHVGIHVLDRDSAKAFYTEELGFEVRTDGAMGESSEPTHRPYGVEALFRDGSGNWFSLTQRADGAA